MLIKKRISLSIITMLTTVMLVGSISVCASDEKEKKNDEVSIEITNTSDEWINEDYEVSVSVNVPEKSEIEIKSVSAKLGSNAEYKDITEKMTYTLVNNGTLYVTVKDTEGNKYQEDAEKEENRRRNTSRY